MINVGLIHCQPKCIIRYIWFLDIYYLLFCLLVLVLLLLLLFLLLFLLSLYIMDNILTINDISPTSFMSFSPVVFYTDLSKEKGDILKDNCKKSGIYRWTHKTSVKIYVGSALDLTRRFKSSFSLSFLEKELRHGNSIICSSLHAPYFLYNKK